MPSNSILAQKQQIVAELAEQLKASTAGVLVNYQGITVDDDTKMRKALREAGVKYMVVKLTDDTLTINGYLCSRAETTFRDIRWEVWYTEEVPSSVGPWRLRGLPGLIVKATGNAHTFTLAELRHETSAITYASDIKIERMKYPKLLKYRNEVFGSKQYPKNPLHYLPANTDMGIEHVTVVKNESGNGGYIIANGSFHMLQKAHVYQPLEKK